MTATPPLAGLRVLEFGGIGPGPHAAMLLSDLGAEIVRIERAGGGWINPVMDRGRAMLALDIRTPEGRDRALAIADRADVIIEGFRPGVMERLGLGPDVVHARNPRLVYGRMTGWGQAGPLAPTAGHDLNYIALSGALAAMGTPGTPPPPPLNLVGDFGGGSMFLVTGILAALLERERSGIGQVVDAAIVDGVNATMAMFAGMVPSGYISMARDRNMLGGAAPFYRCYACADGYMAVGAIEPKFYAELLARLGLPADLAASQMDRATWPATADRFAQMFATRTRAEWTAVFDGSDACVAPVLELAEAPDHPHMIARDAFATIDGVAHPAPAPRFSRTPGRIAAVVDAGDRMRDWGVKD